MNTHICSHFPNPNHFHYKHTLRRNNICRRQSTLPSSSLAAEICCSIYRAEQCWHKEKKMSVRTTAFRNHCWSESGSVGEVLAIAGDQWILPTEGYFPVHWEHSTALWHFYNDTKAILHFSEWKASRAVVYIAKVRDTQQFLHNFALRKIRSQLIQTPSFSPRLILS